MKNKKIFILLPDGVGLRNFAFTSFVVLGEKLGWEVIFWNGTPFNLNSLNYSSIELTGKPRAKTDLIKRAKIDAELDHFTKHFDDAVYQDYKFPPSKQGLKNKVKNILVSTYASIYKGEKGTNKLREMLASSERNGSYYWSCKEILEQEKPDYIFCTNQRPLNAIAPLTAAKDLGIPTASFIFSWDNIPKATLVVNPDIYFVWSEYMKNELLKYYPLIKPDQVHITGTPQFENHYLHDNLQSRENFFKENDLDPDKEYICFSGDDITTSPDDAKYLEDVAECVTKLNEKGKKIGVIFRRCPVDFSGRYDPVLEKYKDIIVPIDPAWIKIDEGWNKVLPTIEDQNLLSNTIFHCEAVINLGSSMIFDFAIFNKPCLFINYDTQYKKNQEWSVSKIYNFVHFRSMPNSNSVFFINSKEELNKKITIALKDPIEIVNGAKKWFSVINEQPAKNASKRIWEKIDLVIDKN